MFLRVFSPKSSFHEWLNKQPSLPKLLKCFDIDRHCTTIKKPPSVFRASSVIEEAENVAALFETAPCSPELRYAVRITGGDCDKVGIQLNTATRGQTGVLSVDTRHADLSGTPKQFRELVVRIVERLWNGEDRLRAFPAHLIAGVLALLEARPETEIEPEARHRCRQVLDKRPDWLAVAQNGGSVRVLGKLDDKEEYPVRAVWEFPATTPGRAGLRHWLRAFWPLRR